jgi:serine/threonine-protein kinase
MLASMDSTQKSAEAASNDADAAVRAPTTRVIAGKYELRDRLGRGGRGEVYRALQTGLGREVAVKLVRDADEDTRARFVREARIAAEIKHPCVVSIFDAGVDEDGTPYCAMELLEGETLDARIGREGRLPASEAVALIASVASALTAVHQKGFLHRDVKPGNIFLAKREDGGVDPKLIDFGVAKRIAVEPAVVERVTQRGLGKVGVPRPTQPGMIVGTPRYLAPEQILGTDLDARCDLYALAVTLYEALAGTPPFYGDDIGELLGNIVCDAPEPLAQRVPDAQIPAALDREVLRALAKEPANRHASVAEFSAALWAALATARVESSAPPPPPLPVASRAPHFAVAFAVVALATLGIVWMRRPAPQPPAPVAAPAITAAPTAIATADPPPREPEVAPAPPPTTAVVTPPPPRSKGARHAATPTPASAAPTAPAPATNFRMDDLKVPY